MFLKLFAFLILTCVVQRALAEETETSQVKYITLKEAAIQNKQNDAVIIDDSVSSLSTVNDSDVDIPIPTDDSNNENETDTETFATSDNLTEVTNQTDVNTNQTESEAEVTTDPVVESEITFSETSTESITEKPNETSPELSSPEPSTPELSSPDTETEPEPSTSESSSTESPSVPKCELSSPKLEMTTIDPKYRNETFLLYLDEFLRNHPSAELISSPGFPSPYDGNLSISCSIPHLTNCTGIEIVIHYLDLNPFLPDTLNIRGGDENSIDEIGKKLTGHRTNILKYKIIHTTTLFIWFDTKPHGFTEHEYQGFVLTYSPFGDNTPPVTTTEPPVTVPESERDTIEVQLMIPVAQTNTILQKIKEVLAIAASSYVTDFKLNVQQAHPENVTISSIQQCPEYWPNYENCTRLEFAISLWNLDYDPEVDFDLSIYEYELSYSSLYEMWDLYGGNYFLQHLGIEEYVLPDGKYILLLWTGISLAVVLIFIAVLYGIWRIDIFREYRRMYNKSDDQQDILKDKSELDLSMYPIPHQPYPTLFETNEMTSAGYYGIDSNDNNPTLFHRNSFHHDMHSEKPVTPNSSRHSVNHFSPNIIDFNDSQFFPDDEETFGRVPSLSPRSKQKLLVLGSKREESIT